MPCTFILRFSGICLSFIIIKAESQCNSSSAIGYALLGHSYRNMSAPDPQTCYTACKNEEPLCRSFNYHVDKSMCDLNNHSSASRPEDLKTSNLCIYFHSLYRVRLGSSSSSPAESCAEIIRREDSIGDGRYWIRPNRTEEPLEIYCNMTNGGDMTSSFDLIFPLERNISNYVISDALTQSLTALTVSLWVKTTERVLVPISYAAGNHMNAILMYLDEWGWFRFLVADEIGIHHTGVLNDNKWHHFCGTWSNETGHMQLFIDGNLKINKTGVAVGATVAAGGKLVLGQDQDIIGGAFDIRQSFAGELAHAYLWNTALDPADIWKMARECKEFPYVGHVVGWADFAKGMQGDVQRRDLSRCHYDPPV